MTRPTMKRCTRCKNYYSRDKFYKNKTIRGGLSWWCKNCDKKAKKPEYFYKSRLRFRHGMTEAEYVEMARLQNNVCAICSAPTPGYGRRLFCVDHDHSTGLKRGLLCYSCNLGLGKFRDSIAFLNLAVNYLKQYGKTI